MLVVKSVDKILSKIYIQITLFDLFKFCDSFEMIL